MIPDELVILVLTSMATLAVTLTIQWYGRRKAGKAITAPDREARHAIELLTRQDQRRESQVDRLQERIAVLERIATDPATRTRREIDALR